MAEWRGPRCRHCGQPVVRERWCGEFAHLNSQGEAGRFGCLPGIVAEPSRR